MGKDIMDTLYIDKCWYEIQEKISSGMVYRHIPAHCEHWILVTILFSDYDKRFKHLLITQQKSPSSAHKYYCMIINYEQKQAREEKKEKKLRTKTIYIYMTICMND
jgi:hypothetical protein